MLYKKILGVIYSEILTLNIHLNFTFWVWCKLLAVMSIFDFVCPYLCYLQH